MLQDRRIAKRYAKAFLHEKLDREEFDTMIAEVVALIESMHTDHNTEEFFLSPVYSREKKIAVVRLLAKKLKFSDYTLSLLEMLIRKKRINLLDTIAEELRDLSDTMHNRIRVTVTTAYEPSPDDLKEISDKIRRFFKRNVLVERRIDRSILGGFVIESEGKMIDMSVMGQIRKALQKV